MWIPPITPAANKLNTKRTCLSAPETPTQQEPMVRAVVVGGAAAASDSFLFPVRKRRGRFHMKVLLSKNLKCTQALPMSATTATNRSPMKNLARPDGGHPAPPAPGMGFLHTIPWGPRVIASTIPERGAGRTSYTTVW